MTELPKAYDPKTVDTKWYKFWKDQDFFKIDPRSEKPPFCIVMPPPNVTGALHMGHALVSTLQDIRIRWKRMQGFEALWIPGVDHAGIATQTVVERHLIRSTGKTRKEFERDVFLKHVWEWKEANEHRIVEQLEALGCSCDWDRKRFTMDEGCNRAVKTMFKKMFDEGLIHRDFYLVNWDPVTQTAIADDEVEYEERDSKLWHFKYPYADGSGHAVIATTRPETMLGDTAVAVNPGDTRYKDLVGKTIRLPLTEREIPVIADHYVDPEFGSGMVKITPAHDPNDYQIGLRQELPMINIMTPDGKINDQGGAFAGMTMQEARKAVVKSMEEKGLLLKAEPHIMRVGISYRSKATIEPYLSKQWFVKMEGFAPLLRKAVENADVRLIPDQWKNTYYHWIDNLRDWCISRQLWWGHRIPVWYNRNDPEKMLCCIDENETPDPAEWIQDEDVLDTWFSSALWPMSTLGWPEKTPEFEKFYPTSVLITGHDILFFWVARMILMGEYETGKAPFPDVFLHGLIFGKSYWRDEPGGGIHYIPDEERKEYDLGKPMPKDVHFKWEKMSKSKGNVIDPLEIIGEYGTDAMRMGLTASATQAREIDLDRRKFEEFKNFANKVWNGARFVFMNLDITAEEFSKGLDEELLRLEDRWILSAANKTVREVNDKLEHYLFDQAAMQAYDFFWKEFCAYYLEISKPVLFGKTGTAKERTNKQKILAILLSLSVRLLHPMAPFITEELFQQLKDRFQGIKKGTTDPYTQEAVEALLAPACIVASYPRVIRESDIDPEIERTFALIENIVYAIRNVRGEINLPTGQPTDIHFVGANLDTVQQNINMITALVRINDVAFHSKTPNLPHTATASVDSIQIVVPIPEDLLEKEKIRLSKEKERLEQSLEKIRKQLSNENFVSRAPEELITQQREKMNQAETDLDTISNKLKTLLSN